MPALQTGEMGYESLLCYDISEYRDGNPWREDMAFTTLPVYRNGSYDASGAGIPLGLGEEEIRARLEAAAAAVCAMGLAGEIAHQRLTPMDGNASYRNYIIDAVYRLTPTQLERGANYEVR